jgi:hypothetical protein
MKNRFLVFAAALICSAILYSGATAQTRIKPPVKPKSVPNELLQLLPPSDAAFSFDARKAFDESVPRVLSANQPMLKDILGKVESLKTRTGIDLRQFDKVVGGMSAIRATQAGYDYEPLMLARGTFASAEIIKAAKTAAAGKFREEKIGDRTVYVFGPHDVTGETKDVADNGFLSGILGKMTAGLNKEIAIAEFDGSTVVIGSLTRVREIFLSSTRIDSALQALVNRKPTSVMSFAARMPTGLEGVFELDDDMLGQNLKSIREIAGSVDIGAEKSDLAIVAKTAEPAQAQALKDMLAGMQAFFLPVLKNSKRADQQMYGRLLESLKMNSAGNEMTMELSIPQSDVNKLVASF